MVRTRRDCVCLPARLHLHGLSFTDIRQEGELASAIDLPCHLALVLGAQARGPLWENLPQPIHVLLKLFRFFVIERDIPLADPADPSLFVEHLLERNLLVVFFLLVICFFVGGRDSSGFAFGPWWSAQELDVLCHDLNDLFSFPFCIFEGVDA